MKKIKAIKVAGAILAGLLLLTAVWQIGQAFTSKELLTEAEAKSLVQEKYGGRINEISEGSDVFRIKFETDSGEFQVEVYRETGEILQLSKLASQEALPEEKVLSEAEIRDKVAQHKKGEIEQVEQKQEGEDFFYTVVVRSETEKTTLKLDAFTGEIVESITDEIKQQDQPAKRLTEQKAVEIALERVSGEVDDVELEQSNGVIYYLIEVEREEEEDATVQVNALSGEIMSVTWED